MSAVTVMMMMTEMIVVVETDAQRSCHVESEGAGLPDSWNTRRSQIHKLECPQPQGQHLTHIPRGRLSPGPAPCPKPCPLSPALCPPCSDRPLSQTYSSIPVSHIRAVERVDEGAFQLPHVMQVVTQDGAGTRHTTYLQCKVKYHKDGEPSASLESHP